ncbi:response regulator transcription factor [Nocardia sp. NPDC059228]|uniref:response regulator transcription factor n=1 Tax=Nocardia sp. NPDC059228 TaxID=3346777 RepID=UPI003693EA4A
MASVSDRAPAGAATVLVVDDEPYILDLLCSALRLSGFEVYSADTGRGALEAATRRRPDVMVLDVMLPDLDGFTVARRLRAAGSEVPVLFLTARDAVEDRIAGLSAGGDDYVSKPFSLEEVILRLHAILRRTRPGEDGPGRLRFADLELDAGTHLVFRAGEQIWLSATEFKLLHYLMLNAGKVVSKRQILDRVWQAEEGRADRVVETFVSQLRRKIDTGHPPLIHTVRGVGYTLRESP